VRKGRTDAELKFDLFSHARGGHLFFNIKKCTSSQLLSINFLSIHKEHAVLLLDSKTGKVVLKPFSKDCRILVNGSPLTEEIEIVKNDKWFPTNQH